MGKEGPAEGSRRPPGQVDLESPEVAQPAPAALGWHRADTPWSPRAGAGGRRWPRTPAPKHVSMALAGPGGAKHSQSHPQAAEAEARSQRDSPGDGPPVTHKPFSVRWSQSCHRAPEAQPALAHAPRWLSQPLHALLIRSVGVSAVVLIRMCCFSTQTPSRLPACPSLLTPSCPRLLGYCGHSWGPVMPTLPFILSSKPRVQLPHCCLQEDCVSQLPLQPQATGHRGHRGHRGQALERLVHGVSLSLRSPAFLPVSFLLPGVGTVAELQLLWATRTRATSWGSRAVARSSPVAGDQWSPHPALPGPGPLSPAGE